MSIELPDIAELKLQQLGLCASVDIADTATREWLEMDEGIIGCESGEGDVRYVRRVTEVLEDHGHVHLEIALASCFGKSPPPNATEESLQSILDDLGPLRGKSQRATVFSEFTVEVDDLPKRGVIATLLGVSAGAGGAELTLNGCVMSVEGEGPYSRLTWYGSQEGRVVVGLRAKTEVQFDDSLFMNCAELMRRGLDMLVLEQNGGKDA